MSAYEMVKDQLSKMVPFAIHTGVVIDELSGEGATCHLEQRGEVENHIQSMHAGALFVLGEQASGAAYAGAFVDRMMALRPVAAKAEISYLKIAKGTITAKAKVRDDVDGLKAKLDQDGKVVFAVDVDLFDADELHVASMVVDWHVKSLS
ncbi:DUF4442 domain-containing protein [Parvularcula sp. ZS-1/3]|uniref:DUF4442 domain-containing protein n=1 Tax=Parvularcula mediterranea TaxID=2732508 RepID=A0A7Y3RPA8_9PROT|nr:DUF4442 domain-containing protein [Parvularcula mediterranea]NNU17201.1 DUF4442 domain-containing protein [Parvularcula mediterranea]